MSKPAIPANLFLGLSFILNSGNLFVISMCVFLLVLLYFVLLVKQCLLYIGYYWTHIPPASKDSRVVIACVNKQAWSSLFILILPSFSSVYNSGGFTYRNVDVFPFLSSPTSSLSTWYLPLKLLNHQPTHPGSQKSSWHHIHGAAIFYHLTFPHSIPWHSCNQNPIKGIHFLTDGFIVCSLCPLSCLLLQSLVLMTHPTLPTWTCSHSTHFLSPINKTLNTTTGNTLILL